MNISLVIVEDREMERGEEVAESKLSIFQSNVYTFVIVIILLGLSVITLPPVVQLVLTILLGYVEEYVGVAFVNFLVLMLVTGGIYFIMIISAILGAIWSAIFIGLSPTVAGKLRIFVPRTNEQKDVRTFIFFLGFLIGGAIGYFYFYAGQNVLIVFTNPTDAVQVILDVMLVFLLPFSVILLIGTGIGYGFGLVVDLVYYFWRKRQKIKLRRIPTEFEVLTESGLRQRQAISRRIGSFWSRIIMGIIISVLAIIIIIIFITQYGNVLTLSF